eukprot:XP_011667430.1 PREDICTED: ras-related protein Rab-21-like [Strongylocentrotus purpuratus]
MLGNDISLCIAGNKIDLEKQRNVSVADAEAYAASVGAKHFHTSAKLNKGIEEMFLDLSKRMLESTFLDDGASSSRASKHKSVTIVEDAEEPKSGGCC